MTFENWQPYIISGAIGLLVGMERERDGTDEKALGVRTLVLISLLGAIAGAVDSTILALAIALFVFSLVTLSYFHASKFHKHDHGLTTEVAAGVVFTLALISHTHPVVTTILGPIVALVLFSKKFLHELIKKIAPSEFQAALLLLLLGLLVVNVIDDRVIDPWGVFNPKSFGTIVLVLGSLEFLSYILAKIFSEKGSNLLIGFVGGLVSSTAVVLSSAKESKSSKGLKTSAYIPVIAAQISALLELLLVVAMVSPVLLWRVLGPIAAVTIFAAGGLLILSLKPTELHTPLSLRSPLDWKGVLRLSVLFAAMLALIAIAKRLLGDEGAFAFSLLGGAFELHGITLANATIFAHDQTTIDLAAQNIIVAVSASLIAKVAVSWAVARNRFSAGVTKIYILLIAVLLVSELMIRPILS